MVLNHDMETVLVSSQIIRALPFTKKFNFYYKVYNYLFLTAYGFSFSN